MSRCTAPATDLDGFDAVRRTRQYTEMLIQNLPFGNLWDDYGVVADIIVSFSWLCSFFLLTCP
jgi:hypothetical protein